VSTEGTPIPEKGKEDVEGLTRGVHDINLGCDGHKEDKLFQEFMEMEALAHSEYSEANKLLGRRNPELIPRSQLRSVKEFTAWMCFVGFDLNKHDHWLRLGLDRASCQGHMGAIGNRLAQATRIVEYGESMKNIKIVSAEWAEMKSSLRAAAKDCLKDLDTLGSNLTGCVSLAPVFGELSREGVDFVKDTVGPSACIYTQSSDLIAGADLVYGI